MTNKRKLSDLIPDHANANKGTERGRSALEASLRKYGAGRSILIDKNGRIISGNKTVETAADIGLDNVIIIQTDGKQIVAVQRTDLDIDSAEGRGLAYADNRVGELSLEWDAEQVLADINAGVDLSALFRQDELDELLADLQPKGTEGDTEPQIDRAEELRQKWGVESGRMWQLGEHRLICGDCTDAAVVARVMACDNAVLLLADPEYDAPMDWLYTDGLCEIPHWLVMAGDRQHIQAAQIFGERFNQFFVVYFKQFSWNLNIYIPILQHLCIAHYRAANAKNYSLNGLHSIIECSSKFDRQSDHPHAKHVKIIEPLIEGFSPDGGVTLDLFSGSGTTIIACENLGRRCRAVEIAPGYVAVALERWATHTGKTPVRVE
jgi:hypothetical protein